MVLDFSDIKRVVSRWIDDNLDHRMILHRDDPAVPLLREARRADVPDRRESDGREHRPADLRLHRSQGFPIVEARLWETPHCFATYSDR